MKRLLLITSLFSASFAFSQTPCETGRYAEDVFTDFTLTSNIEYGSNTSFSGANTTLSLDFYEPTGDTETERPLIIWVHGGSFIGGSKTDIDVKTWSESFARKGYACASISYRLGFFPFDSTNAVRAVVRAVQDLKGAIRYFYKDRATDNLYKIDTTNIFIGGSSAGAITSLHVAYLNDECELSDYLNSSQLSTLGGLEGTSGNAGYSTKVRGVLNGCGALAKYSWLEAGEVPLCSVHGTNDGTVKYNRGIVNPGTPLMYLDGSRVIHERACAVGVENYFYTFPNAPHVPYAGSAAYMDTTINFFRDFLVKQLSCSQSELQPENAPMEAVFLYPSTYCDGSPANEVCATSGITELAVVDWNIYPNPASNQLNIETDGSGTYALSIYDLTGRQVYQSGSFYQQIAIEVQGFNAGNYFVKITDVVSGISETKKLIIQ